MAINAQHLRFVSGACMEKSFQRIIFSSKIRHLPHWCCHENELDWLMSLSFTSVRINHVVYFTVWSAIFFCSPLFTCCNRLINNHYKPSSIAFAQAISYKKLTEVKINVDCIPVASSIIENSIVRIVWCMDISRSQTHSNPMPIDSCLGYAHSSRDNTLFFRSVCWMLRVSSPGSDVCGFDVCRCVESTLGWVCRIFFGQMELAVLVFSQSNIYLHVITVR